jgi:hypothetical protein
MFSSCQSDADEGTVAGDTTAWSHKVDDELSSKICKHLAGLDSADYVQYHAELHKKEYSWQELGGKMHKGRKRLAAEANVGTGEADAPDGQRCDGENELGCELTPTCS